jgi:spore germination protein YaaH
VSDTLTRFRWPRYLLVLACLGGMLSACEAPMPAARELWAYYPWWMREAWREQGFGAYTRLLFFEYRLDGDGNIVAPPEHERVWPALRAATQERWIALDRTVTLFARDDFERLFTREPARARLLVQALALAEEADGLQLDIEIFSEVTPAALSGYREFVQRLSGQLRRAASPKTLSAFLTVGGAQSLYDAATASGLDALVVQGYDAAWEGSRAAGPVAPLRGRGAVTWERGLDDALRLGVARERILFSVPFFGYEWPTISARPAAATRGTGRTITFSAVDAQRLPAIRIDAQARIARFGTRRHLASGAPYYVFADRDGWWQGWYEDEWSLTRKLAFVQRERLGGVAAFAYGYDGGVLAALAARELGLVPAQRRVSK